MTAMNIIPYSLIPRECKFQCNNLKVRWLSFSCWYLRRLHSDMWLGVDIFLYTHAQTHPHPHTLRQQKKGMNRVRKNESYSERRWGREQNDIHGKLLKHMGHVYKREWQRKRSRAEIRKKILVMSMSSVTSFVDLQWVSMTTVKSPRRTMQDTEAPLVLIYSLTWSDMGGVTQMYRADLTDTLICVRG